MRINGKHSVDYFHKKLGHIMWEYVGMSRNAEGLKFARKEIKALRKRILERCSHSGIGRNRESRTRKSASTCRFL